jgi:hypothetical protein
LAVHQSTVGGSEAVKTGQVPSPPARGREGIGYGKAAILLEALDAESKRRIAREEFSRGSVGGGIVHTGLIVRGHGRIHVTAGQTDLGLEADNLAEHDPGNESGIQDGGPIHSIGPFGTHMGST